MDLVHPDVDRYLSGWAASDDPIVKEMEQLAEAREFPIVGPQVGRLLQALLLSSGAQTVLELGSGFGYSAWWFATAVGAQGRVVLTERSTENAELARGFLERAGFAQRVEIHVGDALEVASRLAERFDVVFNDIDKRDYAAALPVALARLRPDGVFVSDNMLWQGQVLDSERTDDATQGVRDLTRALYADKRLRTAILPVRDGVSLSRFTG